MLDYNFRFCYIYFGFISLLLVDVTDKKPKSMLFVLFEVQYFLEGMGLNNQDVLRRRKP